MFQWRYRSTGYGWSRSEQLAMQRKRNQEHLQKLNRS
jgi:hypothetical protein